MNVNAKIAVLFGGISAERDVSLKSGKAAYNAILEAGYRNVTLIDVDFGIADTLVSLKPDVCFLALHGRYGEDGTIQGMLDMMNIPYTGSGVASSVVAFDKTLSKYIFIHERVKTPESVTLRTIPDAAPFMPCVVKPAREGSSIGVTLVHDDESFAPAMESALKSDRKVVVERFVSGKELTVSIVGDRVMPAIWIKPKSGFYDFESKYTKGATEYLFDTGLSEEETLRLNRAALAAYRAVGCRSAARVDFIFDGTDFWALEVNTIPGMTETSLLPQAAAKAGVSFPELARMMIEDAMTETGEVR